MARTDSSKVQSVLNKDYDGKADLRRYIAAANLITSRVRSCAINRGTPLTDAELLEIETWLAAHYYTCSDKTLRQKSTEGASGAYQGTTTNKMEASFYGQTALELDVSGCLSSFDKRQVARGFWLGADPCTVDPVTGEVPDNAIEPGPY